ncbi:MAG: cell division protein FtsW [Miltoncostaeaceae bacterium]|jgi:cell division protein FtsW|nr:cell division protein FtsW [Miltoncostaeaceae bacterium]
MASADRTDARQGRQTPLGGRPERLLAGAVCFLVCFGLVMVYSASSARAFLQAGDPLGLLKRQAAYALAGLGVYCLCARIRPATLRRLGRPALVVSVLLLVVVLVPGIGVTANGASRWLAVGPLQIQPSEVAKLALVLTIAAAIARRPGALRTAGGVVPYLILTGAVALLVLLEPDLGTATTICLGVLGMLLVAGARPRHLAMTATVAIAFTSLAVALEPYRRDRLLAFLHPWQDAGGAGFQIVQAQIALGSGGVFGQGIGQGLQKIFYLPEAHTDMIVATVGEELGLLGVLALIAAFGAVALAGYRIALGARDLHLRVLAAGLTTTVVAQAVINFGAVLGLLPVTGVPLPFVSFGGSSLIVFLAAAGILVNIGRRSAATRPAPGPHAVAPASDADPGGHRRRRDRRPRHAGARLGGGAARARG